MKRMAALLTLVTLCTLGLSPAHAQVDFGLKGVGAQLGLVGPENMDATFGLGVFADLGTLAPNIHMEAHIDYWSKTEDFLGGGGEASARDIALSARGKYAFSVPNSAIQPFAGAGLGIHFVKASVDIPDQDLGGGLIVPGMTVEDSATRLGLDIGGGFSSPINDRADILAEAWYGFVSDVNQFSVKLGFLYRLNI